MSNSNVLIGKRINFTDEKYVFVERYLGHGSSCAAYMCKVFNKNNQQIGWATLKEFLPTYAGFNVPTGSSGKINIDAPAFEINEDFVYINSEMLPFFKSRVLPACVDEFKKSYIEYYEKTKAKEQLIKDQISMSYKNSILEDNISLSQSTLFDPEPYESDNGKLICNFKDNSFVALSLAEYKEDPVIEKAKQLILDEKLSLASLLCAIVAKFHEINIVFLDLKPENFLYITEPEKHIEIFDCDSIQRTNNNGTITQDSILNDNGSPFYRAPEVKQMQKRYVGKFSDVYSVCAILLSFVFDGIVVLDDATHNHFANLFSNENFKKVNDSLCDNENKITEGFWRKLQSIANEAMTESGRGRYRKYNKNAMLALKDDIDELREIYSHKGVHPLVMLDSAIKKGATELRLDYFNEDLLCEIEEVAE